MKVDRIVGQRPGVSLTNILKYRQQFYEGNYDIRLIVEEGETAESISNRIIQSLKVYYDNPGHVSTRGAYQNSPSGPAFNNVVLEGLAPDGGLYVTNKNVPFLSLNEWQRLVGLSYHEQALRILEKWIHPYDLHPSLLSKMIKDAYSIENFDCYQIIPTVHVTENEYITELFHGPTASFKDASLQLMPKFFHNALEEIGHRDKYDLFIYYIYFMIIFMHENFLHRDISAKIFIYIVVKV